MLTQASRSRSYTSGAPPPADPADLRNNGRPEPYGALGGGEGGRGEAAKDEGVTKVAGARGKMEKGGV